MDSANFIEDIINKDLAEGKVTEIVTRFPPEPNGYLHIGHAKSLGINFGMKRKYGGRCNLRFDDSNPAKEEIEYVESIKKDIAWLGYEWDEELYASDYFEKMYECAIKLIKDEKAYVCDLSAEEIKNTRGTLTSPGTNSPYRDRSIEENLRLFSEMREGKFADGEKVLRAKIDMSSPNMNMRDPVLYRIVRAHHFNTGDKWVIYPMYDFAHPLEDAFEGITHSICTLEFEDHRPIYDWVKKNCGFGDFPRQIEFARLNISRTIMSKRYLKKLVDEGAVDGWDDPRMPTLSGMRERGYPPVAIRDFCERVGVAKANSEVDPAMLEHCVREYLNLNATRAMVVKNPLELILTNVSEDEVYDMENVPGKPEAGTHKVTFSNRLFIDGDDFSLDPPPKYKRLTVGGTVRLKGSYILEYERHEVDSEGKAVKLYAKSIPDSRSGGANAGIKVKGVIQWVNAKDCADLRLCEYDYLLLPGDGDFNDRLNPETKKTYDAKAESFLSEAQAYDRFQFVRMGYFSRSSKDAKEFNMIVGLKDSYNK